MVSSWNDAETDLLETEAEMATAVIAAAARLESEAELHRGRVTMLNLPESPKGLGVEMLVLLRRQCQY